MNKCWTTICVCVVGLLVVEAFSAPAAEPEAEANSLPPVRYPVNQRSKNCSSNYPKETARSTSAAKTAAIPTKRIRENIDYSCTASWLKRAEKLQVACPICGRPGNAEFTAESGAAKTHFQRKSAWPNTTKPSPILPNSTWRSTRPP